MGAGVLVVSLKTDDARQLILRSDTSHMIDASFDLRMVSWPEAIMDALDALFAGDGRIISVTDLPPNMSGELIDVAMEEAPLRAAMLGFTLNILLVSVVLSLIVGGLLFLTLNHVLVNPMRRLAANMLAFAQKPEDTSRIIAPSTRSDEIGAAERELHTMQTELATLLQQKSHLAALGLAVSKVSHDLRNMLSAAHLISDRLASVEDPTVQKFAPKLIASLDRAIAFCVQTLKYGRAEEAPPRRDRFMLRGLIDEVIDSAAVQASSRIVLYNSVPQNLMADADRDHIFRVLTNLVRNAIEALETQQRNDPGAQEGSVTVAGWREGMIVTIEVKDNGPGIPEKVRDKLFAAFQSAARPGGTGLGLAIAAELVRAHGGEVWLAHTGAEGTAFHFTVPDRVSALRSGKRGAKAAAEA
jgi:signal transduction histidine kinase